jgi:hypothetical protein
MQATRAKLREASEEVLDSMTSRAIAGDIGAAKLILERSLPPLRASDDFTPRIVDPQATVGEQAAQIMQATAAGQITPSQAHELLRAYYLQTAILEVDELASRIAALEARGRPS